MKIISKPFNKPKTTLIVRKGERELWEKFHPHHYMTINEDVKKSLPSSCDYYTFYLVSDNKEILVGCAGVIFQIHKEPSKRFTRIVVLPEYQGLGIGKAIVSTLGGFYKDRGYRIYNATFHPRLGEYMEHSPHWKGSEYNNVEYKSFDEETIADIDIRGLREGVKMYRHMYVGPRGYKIMFHPDEWKKLAIKVRDYKDKTTKHYTLLRDELKEMEEIKFKGLRMEYEITPEEKEKLSVTDEDHIQSKKEHKSMFLKNKRKPLTPEERKKLKEEKKIAKNKTD